jgi:hypothetical protein
MATRSLTLLALLLLLAGCGGGRLSQQEFTTRANEICGDVNEGLKGIREPSGIDDLGPVLDEGLVVVNDGLDELRKVKPPESLDARYDAWLAKVDEAAKALAKASDAAERDDQAAVGLALQEGDDANVAANRLATQLGLRTCAED